MKKKGKIDNSQLQKFGIDIAIKEDQGETQVNDQDIEAVRERQNREMKQLLEQEKRAEADRQSRLNSIQDEAERTKLLKEFEQAKAVSSDKIAKLQNTHQQELKALEQV